MKIVHMSRYCSLELCYSIHIWQGLASNNLLAKAMCEIHLEYNSLCYCQCSNTPIRGMSTISHPYTLTYNLHECHPHFLMVWFSRIYPSLSLYLIPCKAMEFFIKTMKMIFLGYKLMDCWVWLYKFHAISP